MDETNLFKVGDKVTMNGRLYKVTYVYDNGELKLQSIRGKPKIVLYSVPADLVQTVKEK